MIRLDKELEAVKAAEASIPEHQAIKDVKMLLAGEETEDARILRGIGAKSMFVQIEKDRGRQIELENLEKEYSGGVFTLDQIKILAVKYRLRFLSSSLFSSHIDIEITARIKELSKKANVNLDEWTLQTSFMILAPRECFTLENKKFIKTPTERGAFDMDPLMFYKINDDKYRLVHKWGNDFSILRRIEGYRWRNLNTYYVLNFFTLLPVIAIIGAIVFNPIFLISHPIWYSLITLGVNALCTLAFNSPVTDENWFDQEDGFFSENNWNSKEKLV